MISHVHSFILAGGAIADWRDSINYKVGNCFAADKNGDLRRCMKAR